MKWTSSCHRYIRGNRIIEPFEPIEQATERLFKEGKIVLAKYNGHHIYVLPGENDETKHKVLLIGLIIESG